MGAQSCKGMFGGLKNVVALTVSGVSLAASKTCCHNSPLASFCHQHSWGILHYSVLCKPSWSQVYFSTSQVHGQAPQRQAEACAHQCSYILLLLLWVMPVNPWTLSLQELFELRSELVGGECYIIYLPFMPAPINAIPYG